MSYTYFQKPENAIKRANELIAIPTTSVAADRRQKITALELLHDTLTHKRVKTWQKSHEDIMMKYIEISVALQMARVAKDGLHQYRNLAQQQNPSSLATVIDHLINEAEKRLDDAKRKSNQKSLIAAVGLEDLDAGQTPESVLLSTTSTDGAKDRTDRAMIIPWLKFLWESYRTILDILRWNSKLEVHYHLMCKKAFKFCVDYSRKLEFRRLCEMLRGHVLALQKHAAAPSFQTTRQVRGWDGWTSESVEMHLQTGYAQLEAATQLEHWNEGFRTIEDIHNVMGISKKPPKASLMATYYEKLIQIFWVSENYLFHAYAWYSFHKISEKLSAETPKSDREKQDMASHMTLAALSMPLFDGSSTEQCQYDLSKEKTQRMATLLGFFANPSRRHLHQQITSEGIVELASPEIRDIYRLLERPTPPLHVVAMAQEKIKVMKTKGDFLHLKYVSSLEKLLVQRLIKQLSSVYSCVTLAHFKSLIQGLNLQFHEVEQLVVKSAKEAEVGVRIDHRARCLVFGLVHPNGREMQEQLSCLGSNLKSILAKIVPSAHLEKERSAQRAALLSHARECMGAEHQRMLNRKLVIEKRKEDIERIQQEKIRVEQRRQAEYEKQRMEMEKARLEKEARLREKVRMQRMKDEIELQETKQMLGRLGRDADSLGLENLEEVDRAAILKETKEKAQRAKEEAQRKHKEQAKRLDYITRATREAEQPILAAGYVRQCAGDLDVFEKNWSLRLKQDREAWEYGLKEKARLIRMSAYMEPFEVAHTEHRRDAYEERQTENELRLKIKRIERKVERAVKRFEEEQKRLKAEQEERQRLEDEAKIKKLEEERRIRMAKKEEEDRERREARALSAARRMGEPERVNPSGSGMSSMAASDDSWERPMIAAAAPSNERLPAVTAPETSWRVAGRDGRERKDGGRMDSRGDGGWQTERTRFPSRDARASDDHLSQSFARRSATGGNDCRGDRFSRSFSRAGQPPYGGPHGGDREDRALSRGEGMGGSGPNRQGEARFSRYDDRGRYGSRDQGSWSSNSNSSDVPNWRLH